jgi:hypothetical protein
MRSDCAQLEGVTDNHGANWPIRTMIAEIVDLPYSTADSLSTHYCIFITNGVSLTSYCLHTLCDFVFHTDYQNTQLSSHVNLNARPYREDKSET